MIDRTKGNSRTGYYTHRHFDGKHGIPKCDFYLSSSGLWVTKLVDQCRFPNKELAQAFCVLRVKYENALERVRQLEFEAQFRQRQ